MLPLSCLAEMKTEFLCEKSQSLERQIKQTTEFTSAKSKTNKTCHRDRIARLTAPCSSHKNFNVKVFANADAAANANIEANADADAGGNTIALSGLRPGELKMLHASFTYHTGNSVDPDELALNEPPHLDLRCLYFLHTTLVYKSLQVQAGCTQSSLGNTMLE